MINDENHNDAEHDVTGEPKLFYGADVAKIGCLGVPLGLIASAGFAIMSLLYGWWLPWPVLLLPAIIILWIFVYAGITDRYKKKVGIALLCFVAAIALVSGVYKLVEPVTVPDNSSINIGEYKPFDSNSKLVRLPQSASLKLTNNLPVIDGATALVPVYHAFVEAVYPNSKSLHTDASPVHYSSTSRGYSDLADGKIDIMFAAYPSDEQLEYTNAKTREMEFTPIGKEGFVFFVNEANPVQSLTLQQIRDMYSGKITNWSQVGGANAPVKPYQRNSGSGSQSAFLRFMDSETPIEPDTHMEPGPSSMGDMVRMVNDYQNSSGAIGFSFRYYTQEMMRDYPVKLLAIDDVAPTVENIANGTYPLSSEFYAVTIKQDEEYSEYMREYYEEFSLEYPEDAQGDNVKLFIDWILSSEGQYIIKETGYIPINL